MPTLSESNEAFYKIYVTTSKISNASFSANVFLQIFGKRRINNSQKQNSSSHDLWSIKFPLKNNLKKFRAGSTEVFEVTEVDVGKLKKLRVSHDSLSNWHLKKIIIKIPKTNRVWKFKCNSWIGKKLNFSQN